MKISSTDFYKDWDRHHASQPSPQDIIDWTVKEVMKRLLLSGKSDISIWDDGSC